MDDGWPLCGPSSLEERHPYVFTVQEPAWPCTACLEVLNGTATRRSIERGKARIAMQMRRASAEWNNDTDEITRCDQWFADHPPIIVSSGGST